MNKSLEEVLKAVEGAEYIFVHQKDNWADEMDVEGFAVFSRFEFDQFIAELQNTHFPITRHFGTNEEGEYSNLNEYLYWWKLKPITLTEYTAFQSIFLERFAGSFYKPECGYECWECDIEENDDEETE